MKRQMCQAKAEAKTWDDLIEFTEAKIREMKEALKNFRRMKDAGMPWQGNKSAASLPALQDGRGV
jgi:hypothetical protein